MYRQFKAYFFSLVSTSVSSLAVLRLRIVFFTLLSLLYTTTPSFADVPITLYRSFAGNINVTATGATLRTQPNTGNACLVTNGSVTMPLSGIPAGSTITAAYLYWAGSGSAIDSVVTFNGNSVTADRTFTASTVVTGTTYNFFSGFKDVTTYVTGNGNYTFADLTVDTGATYCGVSAVLSGAALIVIYSNASEDFRVINAWDGFQIYYNSSITLNPTNFRIPTSPINGRHLVVTWEGDPDITGGENISFNGTNLSDALNAAGSLWNSTINTIPSSAAYGVDVDVFDVSSYLTAGATSATAIYSTGGDLVILSTQVMSVTNVPVADLAIAKSHAGNFTVGTNNAYTLTVTNNGPNNATGTITVTDTLPAGLTYVSATGTGWTCGAVGQTVTCTRPGPLANGATAPAITLTVAVGAAAYPAVTNTAAVTSGSFDNVAANSSSSDLTTVLAPNFSTSTKTVVDINAGDANPGDVLRYTITVNETAGVLATGVTVTDPIPANVTGFTVVSFPTGAVNSSTGAGTGANGTGYLNITNITVPANGSVTIVFDVTIGAVAAGTLINNSAVVTPPAGVGATPAAPTVTVSASQIPGTGNKPLYLYSGPTYTISRTPPTGTPATVTIGTGASQTWTQLPVAQGNITINPSVSATVPVILQAARSGGTAGNMSLTVSLQCSSGGTTLTQTANCASGAEPTTQQCTYNLPLAAPLTCAAGNSWRLTILNNSGTRTLYVHPVSGGNNSRVVLPATTVISVPSVTAYSTAYPGATIPTFFPGGGTAYIRAVVSDPFGSFDIASAAITIRNSNNTIVVNGAAMTQVADSGTLTKTYEYAYPVPSTGPAGYWTATVTAPEGTEGTISDNGVGTFNVVLLPSITIVKAALTQSDPVNTINPKAIPGAVMMYTIMVTNSGLGAADNNTIVLTDPIPANTTMSVDTGSGDPVTFACSATPACGLTWNYTTAVSYSSQPGGGPPYNYTPGTVGYDPLVTGIRINPLGTLNGNGANFTVQFRVRVN